MMSIKNFKFEKFGDILANDVLNRLVGSHDDFKRINVHDPPSKNILVGVLHGFKQYDKTELEDKRLVNSISVKFLIADFKSKMNLDFEFYVYYRVFPTYEEQMSSKRDSNKDKVNMVRVWKRKKVEGHVTVDETNEEISLFSNLNNVIDEIKADDNVLRKVSKIPAEYLESENQYIEFIENQKSYNFDEDYTFKARFKIDKSPFIQNDEELCLINISLVNDTVIDKKIELFDTSFFNPILKLSLNDNEIIPFTYNKNGYYFEDYLRCLNCQGNYDEEFKSITTTNYAIFNQKKVVPINSLDEIDISFETLSKKDGVNELNVIYHLMNKFYESSQGNSVNKKEFFDMKERFKESIDLLKNNDSALKAFNLMNETFQRNSKYDSWRLFQIVFIVSQLKDIVSDEQKEVCELLHVMTGGGKSETYFGIVIFTAFYDRLSGKKFGVSAITKFPLRMLSIQQLQRIANIFIHAEQIRKKEKIPGDEFSIAYFVGSQDSDFPGDNREILLKIADAKDKKEKIKGKIIDECPLCGRNVFLDVDEDKQLIVHRCDSCHEEFRLYYTDDEIYRTLPTFIVSTVDKWAGIALNRRYRNLLGGDLAECQVGHGFMPAYDKCSFKVGRYKQCQDAGKLLNVSFDTSPTIIIQDEMHLIKEGFGTIDSHFESLMEVMKSEFTGGSKFKNIVMTATVSGAEKQIKNLYHKDTRIFPPHLKDKNNNTFFFNQLKEDDADVMQRRVIGLKPSILSYRLIFNILRYISIFIKNLEENADGFSKEHGFTKKELEEICQYYKKLLTYHNKKEAAHNVAYSIDDYVNNHEDNYKVRVQPLTGDNNLDEIKDIMNTINHFYDDENNQDKLYAVNATNIVSHGVDIDEWNIMIFDGMPRSTSEYIQALSRVGRKFFGLVFVIFSSTKTRDLSFYQNFNEYHEMLDSKVEIVPLARWAKLGFKQTFTSVFAAALLNYFPNISGKLTYNPKMAKNVLMDKDNRSLLVDFIKKAYISNSKMLGAEFFDHEIENEFNIRADWLINHDTNAKLFTESLAEYNYKYFKTQYGMRGIQDEISLSPINADYNFRNSLRRKY